MQMKEGIWKGLKLVWDMVEFVCCGKCYVCVYKVVKGIVWERDKREGGRERKKEAS